MKLSQEQQKSDWGRDGRTHFDLLVSQHKRDTVETSQMLMTAAWTLTAFMRSLLLEDDGISKTADEGSPGYLFRVDHQCGLGFSEYACHGQQEDIVYLCNTGERSID